MLWKLLSAALLAAALACAQRGGTGGRGMDEETGGGRATPSRRPSKLDQLADKLKLNADQKAEARTIIVDAGKETAPLQQQLMQARQNLAGALIAGNSEQADQALTQYTPLAAQLAAVEAKSFAKICAMLKPGQQAKAGPAFTFLAGIYEPAPSQNQDRRGNRSDR
jgi:hypothetical protein